MIRDEVLEVAAKAMWEASTLRTRHNTWEFLEDGGNFQAGFRQQARAALEAAEPYMLAGVWGAQQAALYELVDLAREWRDDYQSRDRQYDDTDDRADAKDDAATEVMNIIHKHFGNPHRSQT